jgi:hypothetical protein
LEPGHVVASEGFDPGAEFRRGRGGGDAREDEEQAEESGGAEAGER